ncbi:asparaginase [Georgenia sp. 10Sc9-8]|uniref:Asparaginase n=1 Tax=Georgenia halotolerans TaxID=3028317 RepID=A0ABT5TYR7_9MICO|nr:asparaginase [Georgenia halotolerans]
MSPGELLAVVVRDGVTESVHTGHLVVAAPDGAVLVRRGRPEDQYFPRSSLKPLQALAMLRCGLDLPPEHLALACASHSGEEVHVAAVRAVLTGAGLTEAALQNTPDLPLDAGAARRWQEAGNGASAVTQNCSGKHAAMLATCMVNGWETAGYLAVDHPLQQAVRGCVAELTGEAGGPVSVDGCGAPLFSCSLTGLARAFARLATAAEGTVEARVADAMRSHPELVGGTGRDVTAAMRAVPGLLAKDGAEGVYAAATSDGGATAFKVADGGSRPRPVVLGAALRRAGVDAAATAAWSAVPVLGHGAPVGEVLAWDDPRVPGHPG